MFGGISALRMYGIRLCPIFWDKIDEVDEDHCVSKSRL